VGVRLETIRSTDDPLDRSEQWTSTEEMLVPDSEASHAAAEGLVRKTRAAVVELQAEVDRGVRQATIAYLREHAPDLEPWVAEVAG
jgi:hypothetical protein